jgi:hypothetical protein
MCCLWGGRTKASLMLDEGQAVKLSIIRHPHRTVKKGALY